MVSSFTICTNIDCTGCSACFNACPTKSIQMIPDNLGFLRPQIDFRSCIGCNSCIRSCPNNSKHIFNKHSSCFAVVSKKRNSFNECSSGGVASTIIEIWSKQSDCESFCTVFDNILKQFRFAKIDKLNVNSMLYFISGSKYIQSNVGNTFLNIKNNLTNNVKTLFLGTPCQVAGLKTYLLSNGVDIKFLYTVGIICHGVPSQKMLFDHLLDCVDIETINDIKFRKAGKYCLCVFDKDKKNLFSKNPLDDCFLEGFQNNLILRDSCFNCRYASSNRLEDITLGDYWGLGDNSSLLHNRPSLLMVNNSKGMELFELIKELCLVEERELEEAVSGNSQLKSPSKPNNKRAKFIKQYQKNCFDKAVKKSRTFKSHFKRLLFIKHILKRKWNYD